LAGAPLGLVKVCFPPLSFGDIEALLIGFVFVGSPVIIVFTAIPAGATLVGSSVWALGGMFIPAGIVVRDKPALAGVIESPLGTALALDAVAVLSNTAATGTTFNVTMSATSSVVSNAALRLHIFVDIILRLFYINSGNQFKEYRIFQTLGAAGLVGGAVRQSSERLNSLDDIVLIG
jgi:hypothetical protein